MTGRQKYILGGFVIALSVAGFFSASYNSGSLSLDEEKVTTFTLIASDGYKAELKLDYGFAPYRRLLKPGSGPFRIDFWSPELEPYWAVWQDYRAQGGDTRSQEWLKLDYRNLIHLELFQGNEGQLRKMRDNTVLPPEVDRNFETRFQNFYFLGGSAQAEKGGPTPGIRYRRRSDGSVQLSASPSFWYVPVDAVQYPAAYMKCTRVPFEPRVSGSCTAFQELNDRIFYSYRFSPYHLADWPALDARIHAFLSARLNDQGGS